MRFTLLRPVLTWLVPAVVIGAVFVLAPSSDRTRSGPRRSAAAAAFSAEAPARRVKVLWLGDDGHHQPLARCRQAFTAFAERGIDFTYTTDLSSLSAETLNRYDALLLYANIAKITPPQEQALLDYVASGKGFVPVHCGSYCFLNSPKITALVGGRFKRHGTGVFRETIVMPDHPIEERLKPIESWDESYVHEMHNEQDRTVLGVREENGAKEPYTWTRTHGDGRVFYTAWGHDERTWGNADFQNLLERGIRWAAGDWAMKPYAPPAPPTVKQEHPIPNYTAGGKWGAEGSRIYDMQKPLPPAESVKHMVLPPGFEAKLYAAEPQIYKPVCMTFDERGRAWVAETVDYPNDLQEQGKGNDQIKICEDTDGDGAADKFTVFADKLSVPTSLCVANGGLIVAAAPDTLFLKDTDGDGKADERKVLFTGWGTADTHAGPSNLRYGFDNWVWGIVGYAGFKGTVGGQEQSFRQGIFRFKPDGSRLEFLGNVNNNAWGLGLSETGEVFASTANSNPAFHLSIPNRYYEQVKGMPARQMEMIADSPNVFPVTPGVRQMDHHGEYTAGAGFALYTARSYPKEYWNRVAFLTEPTAHIVGQFVLEPKGSTYAARNDFNLFGSTDGWTSPIMAEVGPDGSVWVVDWYNYIIQHNPIPKGFEKGTRGAYVTPLRDKTHGRIYRLVYKDGTPSKAYDLSKASGAELVEALKSDNMLWRLHAQRLIVERGDKSVLDRLTTLVNDQGMDALDLNAPAVHSLWTMHGLGLLDNARPEKAAFAAAAGATAHPSWAVRAAAVDVLPREVTRRVHGGGNGKDEFVRAPYNELALELDDKAPQVRKRVLLALSETPPDEAAGAAVYGVVRSDALADRSLADAATIAAARHDAGFLKAVFAAHPNKGDAVTQPSRAPAKSANLIPNGSFEELGVGGAPKGWKPRHYAGEARQEVATGGHNGDRCVKLASPAGADTSWHVDVPVAPNTDYTLSAWIKTENVDRVGSGLGALFNIHNLQGVKTPAVAGTRDWTQVEVTFNSGTQKTLSINCLLGGWGRAKGNAWFDDVELVRLETTAVTGLAPAEARVIEAVVNQYAQRAPSDSVVATLAAAAEAEPGVTMLVLKGLSAGWPANAAPQLSADDAAALQSLMSSLPPDGRDRLLGLASKWGRSDLFNDALAASKRELAAAVANAALDAGKRAAAARRLIAIDDGPATVEAVLVQVNPASPPDVQAGLLNALADSRNAEVGPSLVKRWGTLTPAAQRASVEVLLRRPPWTRALLDGVKGKAVSAKDLLPQHWQALTTHPDDAVRAQAKVLEKSTGSAVSPDRKAVVDKLLPLADQRGDAARGRLVYERNCMVCHAIDGQGGKVGPLLTGIGAKPRADNLIDILDPNRSVEGTYRQWSAKTEDDVITGRLSAESRTSVELIDAAGQVHTLQRDQVKRLTASDRSMMPEGFEQLPPQELTDLLEYLATSKVKP